MRPQMPNNFKDPLTAVRYLSVPVATAVGKGQQVAVQISMDFREFSCRRGRYHNVVRRSQRTHMWCRVG